LDTTKQETKELASTTTSQPRRKVEKGDESKRKRKETTSFILGLEIV
jgi:hypothetical protein